MFSIEKDCGNVCILLVILNFCKFVVTILILIWPDSGEFSRFRFDSSMSLLITMRAPNFLILWCILYAADAILLGFEHYLVMLGTTVIIPTALVPQMGGGNVRPKKETKRLSRFCHK